jgi:23S rRNA (adenine-C8)-methyltransferase
MQHLIPSSRQLQSIAAVLEKHGMGESVLKRVAHAIYRRHIPSYRNLNGFLRQSIINDLIEANDNLESTLPQVHALHSSTSQQCNKMVLALRDQESIEAVWMRFKQSQHASLCISSQVGCALKCNFCATGAVGFRRQLSADEIIAQVRYFHHQRLEVGTVSFMGMGEALQNPQVFHAMKLLTDVDGLGMSQRRLSVSTVGIVPGVLRLTRDFPQVNLAFSLHSPFPDQRNVLVPTNKIFPLSEVMKVLEHHATVTRRKIFLAYLVLVHWCQKEDR